MYTLCHGCNEPTDGSQYHRRCLFEELHEEEDQELVALIHPYESTKEMLIDSSGPLGENYDMEAFIRDGSLVDVKRYLTSECTTFDFFLQEKFHKDAICFNSGRVRMKKGVYFANGFVYHLNCNDENIVGLTHGIMEVNAYNHTDFVNGVVKNTPMFFCALCDKFIFETVECMSDLHMTEPDHFPLCEKVALQYDQDGCIFEVRVHKLIAVVQPTVRRKRQNKRRLLQQQQERRVRRRLNFDLLDYTSSDETDIEIN